MPSRSDRPTKGPGPRSVRRVPALAARSPDAHKGSFGTVLVVAGSVGMLGAAILAARGRLIGFVKGLFGIFSSKIGSSQ